MNFRFTVVERSLNRAEFRWKWLRFWRYSFILGALGCLLFLGVGAAIHLGWLTNKALVITLLGASAVLGLIAWLVVLLTVVAARTNRNWLANAMERVDSRLLDRLNTLLFLESRRGDAHTESFALRIAKQTQSLLAEKPSPRPFSGSRTGLHFCGFIILLTITVLLFQNYSPGNACWRQRKPKPTARTVRKSPSTWPCLRPTMLSRTESGVRCASPSPGVI